MPPRWRIAALCLGLYLLSTMPAAAQAPGTAVITAPREASIVSGIASIIGTATHPQFQRYELAFGYDPNPTDTWFSIGEPSTTQIASDVLGRWDTTGIADGVYILRLRVYESDRVFIEAFVREIRIQNSENETATPSPQTTEIAETSVPTLTPNLTASGGATGITQSSTSPPPTSTPPATSGPAGIIDPEGSANGLNTQTVTQAFFSGVRLTIVFFLLIGAYAGLRAALRARR
jgi:hypothetical protein